MRSRSAGASSPDPVSRRQAGIRQNGIPDGDAVGQHSRKQRRPNARRSRTLLLPALLARAVERDPRSVALRTDEVSLTYADLDSRSTRLARRLIRSGAGPDTVVAVGLRRSIDSVIAVWAVAKTGAAFLPVDPDYPSPRVRHMLADSGAQWGITDEDTLASLPLSADWVVLGDDVTENAIGSESAEPIVQADRVSPLLAQHPAYVIYTSGSTGEPKGVAVTHSGIEALSTHLVERLGLTADARTLHFASPSFDASILEYLIAFGAGSSMVVAAPGTYGGQELQDVLERHGVSHAFFTPGVLATLDPSKLETLRTLVVGGEACSSELMSRWASGRSFHNAYGPTETTIVSAMSEALGPGHGVTLGDPISGFDFRILDVRMNEVPPGVAGELHLTGPGVARGYLGRPSLTAGRFVADPAGDPGARMYRTGDIVRRDAQGDLAYIGRSDLQVKVRGHRVELGEVDAALTNLIDVEFSLTKCFENERGATLVSYVLPAKTAVFDVERVRRSVGDTLPAHMVPAVVVEIDRIPLTAAGKVDRTAFIEPRIDVRIRREPSTTTEIVVAEVYSVVLRHPEVGADDDFFDLGGNSLIGTQVAARIGRKLGKRVPAKLLFEDPSVSGLARLVDGLPGARTSPPLVAVARPDLIPLSYAQQRMWFLGRLDTASGADNIPVALRLTGALDVLALQKAVRDVVSRHESLRTMYPEIDGIAHQRIVDVDDVPLGLDPVPVLPAEIHAVVRDLVATGFDSTSTVPLRVDLLQLSPVEHVLVVTVHHIAADGFSIGPLTRDITTAYSARLLGVDPDWVPLPVQYADFAVWQRTVLGDDADPASEARRQLAFWQHALAGHVPAPAHPAHLTRPKVSSHEGASTTFDIDAAVASSVADAARRYESSVFMLAHTALAVVLARSSGSDDVVIGTAVAGRGEPELDELVGMFVNTIALRTTLNPHSTVEDTVAHVRTVDLEAFEHTDIPFERVVDSVSPERDSSRHPIFQVMLTLQNTASETLRLPGLTISPVETQVKRSEFDLSLTLTERFDASGGLEGLHGLLVYSTDLFDERSARTLVDRFVRVLEFLCRDGAASIAAAPFTTAAELAFVDERGCGQSVDDPDVQDLYTTFRHQVRRTPDAVALRAPDENVTYAALHDRVVALAGELDRRGVGPEDTVAVAIARSVGAVVATYAVVAVGAAYVPIDIHTPRARVDTILRTVQPVVTLVDGVDAPISGYAPILDIATVLHERDAARFEAWTPPARHAGLHLAYVIFTSGSTGTPKGVAISQAAVNNQLNWLQQRYPLDEHDAVLFKTSMTFDASVWEVFWPLRTGACMVVASPEGHRDPDYIAELIGREGVTVAQFVPSFLSTMNEVRGFDRPSSLRHVFSGGEQLSARTAFTVAAASGARVHNLYGPTETTLQVVVHDAQTYGSDPVVPIGTPVRGTVVRVLDDMLRPVAPDIVGELYIGGVQLARGYHARPEVTAERFVADPFGPPGGRLYRTGDTVYWTAEGELVYKGRTDTQVKLNGQRVELGDIESALAAIPSVVSAAAAVRAGRVVGYVVGDRRESSLAGDAIREATESVLPEHMVPSTVVVLDSMPTTAGGKIDRRALPDPVPTTARDGRAAEGEFEVGIAQVFAEVLHVDRVGVDDSFFALGGDSIMSIQLVSRARARGISFSPRDVFEHKTVARLAASATDAAVGTTNVLAELPGRGIGVRPLLPIERRTLERGGWSRFAQNIVLELPLGIERESLVATLTAVIDHHDALRSTLVRTAGDESPTMVISQPGDVDVDALVHRVDVVSRTVEQRRDVAAEALDAALGRLAPEAGIVMQFVWLDHGRDAPGRLLVVAHHFVVDGVSWRILVPDLVMAWNGRHAPGQLELPPVTTSVRAWAHALLDEARSEARAAEVELWTRVLEGPDPNIGHRRLDPRIDVMSTVRQLTFEVPAEVTVALTTTVPERLRTGVDNGLIAALGMAVSAWRRDRGDEWRSTLVHIEGHGREQDIVGADLSRTVGWFTSIYPVRLDSDVDVDDALRGGTATGAVLKTVKEQLIALPDRGIGFGLLRYGNEYTSADLARYEGGQISFNYLGKISTDDVPSDLRGLGWVPARDLQLLDAARDVDMPAAAVIDIDAIVVDTEDGLALRASFSYPEGAIDRGDVDALGSLWVRALGAVTRYAADLETTVLTPSDVPLVDVGQSELEAWEARYRVVTDVWSLSPLQEGLLFHARLAENSVDVYTMQVVLDVVGSVREEALRAAAGVIVDRYPNLRAAFHSTGDGTPVQIIVADVDIPWRTEDVSTLAAELRDDAVRVVLEREQSRPFDLSEPPLVRFALIRIAADRWKFAVTNHHLLTDGWSVPLIMKDLLALYATGSDAHVLPHVPSYRTFLAWLAGRDRAESAAAWSRALDGLNEPTSIASIPRIDREFEARATEYTARIDAATTAALTDVAGNLGVTVNTIVQTAWGLLLGRVTGRDDVVFGATVSGRPAELPGVESMVGLFINTLPVRIRSRPSDTAASVLMRVQDEQAALIDHHHVGLADITRDVGIGPLFDTLVVFESYPVDEKGLVEQAAHIDDMSVIGVSSNDNTHYPVTVTVTVGAESVVQMKFAHGLFDDATMDALLRRFVAVLHTVSRDPYTPVADIDTVESTELEVMFGAWNDTDHDVEPSTLLTAFHRSVSSAPDATALDFEGETLTYAAFAARVDAVARVLIDAGVGPDTLVALAMSRSIEFVVGMYAVLEAGGAFVPIDPAQPIERNEYVLALSRPVCVLTAAADAFVATGPTPIIHIDELGTPTGRVSRILDEERTSPLRPDSLAYVIFTSGSTGLPKGVAITHRSVENQMQWFVSEYSIGAADVYLQKTATTFDVSLWGYLAPLRVGATLVLAAPDGQRDSAYLGRIIEDKRVTLTDFVPTMLSVFVQAVVPSDLTSLRAVFVIGEALPAETVRAFADIAPAELHNVYGPTEATVAITAGLVRNASGAVAIGRPIWNSTVAVLDSRLRPVPIGSPGELYLAGSQLARGYLHRPDLTAGRFVASPHPSTPGDRMYRTGDLVRWGYDGQLFYLGRTDFQIKLRGQRIELEEIEVHLLALSGVNSAVVTARSTASGEHLVAYVVADASTFDTSAASAALSRKLPHYMVPTVFVVLNELPSSSSGKLDRNALPEPEFTTAAFRAPETETQRIVAATVEAVLGGGPVGLDDNFFELGGNSLGAMRLAARLSAELRTSIPVRHLFDAPSIETLAASLETRTDTRPLLRPMTRPDPIPLSSAQRRMWFLARLEPHSVADNISLAIRLTGRPNVDALSCAVVDLLDRHEALRTVYPTSDAGIGYQRILPAADVAIDLSPYDIAPDLVVVAAREFFGAGFDITAEVPIRVRLLRCGPEDHVLFVVVHHIAADGFSLGPLTRDVMRAYAARVQGSAPDWRPLAVQYADYTLWQSSLLGSSDDPHSIAAAQSRYWLNRLAGFDGVARLPKDHPRPSRASGSGARVGFSLDPSLSRRIRDTARAFACTPFMVLHGALAVLLSRITGSSDVAVGTPVAGRGEAALDDVIGMFVNTLVLRTEVRPDASFGDVLTEVRRTDVDAFGNSDLPFEDVVDLIDPPRIDGVHPLVQVMLALENPASTSFVLPGLEVAALEVAALDARAVASTMDLQFTFGEYMSDEGEVWTGSLVYATDLFDPSTAESLCRRFVAVLEQSTADPSLSVGEFDLFDIGEAQHLLALATPASPVSDSGFLLDGLDDLARRDPARTALVADDGETWSYSDVTTEINRLARYLSDRGVGAGDRVGLALPRTALAVIAVGAVLGCGAAYVPLDPEYPLERVRSMIEQSGAALVLSTSDLPDIAQIVGVELVRLDGLDYSTFSPEPLNARELVRSRHTDDPAYVLFTSGSTGRPKGVIVGHRAAANHVRWFVDRVELAPTDSVLLKTPLTFDASVWELFGGLTVGARLVIAASDGHRDPRYLASVLGDRGVTVAQFVPSMVASVLEWTEPERQRALRTTVVGGEPLHASVASEFGRATGSDIVNVYGPTETTVQVTARRVRETDVGVVPLGDPAWNTGLVVLDQRLKLVPVGVVGELYVSGIQLAQGYASRAGLTAERFVANPFDPGARLYRTGDLVRRTSDGELEFHGRSDLQIKLRGQRIELEDIESVVRAHPGVSQAAADVRSDRLVAYIVGTAERSDVEAFARERLPYHLTPASWVVVDEIPKSTAGKIDRKSLPDPDLDLRAFRPPGNPVEHAVAHVFGDVLGLGRVGLDDEFFALGGNSLTAAQVAARLSAALDRRVPLRLLFDTYSVADLARRIGSRSGRGLPRLQRRDRPEHIPLSFAQQRMWFLNRLDTSSAVDNIPIALRLSGSLNVQALHASINDVVLRHESLRTVYPDIDGVGFQSVRRIEDIDVPIDVRKVDSETVVDVATAFFGEGFDVTSQVPLRVAVLELDSDDHVLLVVAHHIAADGFSMRPLTRDLTLAYAARAAGSAPSWSPLPVQYADFALWQREVLGRADDPESLLFEQERFWETELSGYSGRLALPTVRPRPRVAGGTGATHTFGLSPALRSAVGELAARTRTTPFMVLHATLAALLSRLADATDVAVGTPVAGRGRRELDDMVGMFVNTLVLRTAVDSSATFEDFLMSVRLTDIAAFEHSDLPFERVVEINDPERSQAWHPVVQVLFSFHNVATTAFALPNLAIEAIDVDAAVAKMDLQVTVGESATESGAADGYVVQLTYATDVFDLVSMQEFGARFEAILAAATDDPRVVLGDIDILGATEREAFLEAVGDSVSVGSAETILDAFDRTVLRDPDVVALVFGDTTVTYRELDSAVRTVAAYLRGRGVGPESRVVVALDRSVDLVVAVYAILRAGGAYVPMDPAQPAGRNSYIVDAVGPDVILTQTTNGYESPHSVTMEEIFASAPSPTDDVWTMPRPENVAYVLFTSGSTGRPKGVAVTHASVVNQVTWMTERFELGQADVVLFKTPVTFDVSVWELFVAPACGARMVIAEPGGHRDPTYLEATIARERVTAVSFVPSMLALFAAEVVPESLHSVRCLFVAGEALSSHLAGSVRGLVGPGNLHNLYGPTECTVHATAHTVDSDVGNPTGVPIGTPVDNTRVHVLDGRLRHVPADVVGELYLGGVQVARAYHDRPDLTAERFVADPYSNEGARLYRTGDLVRRTPAGELLFIGRSDNQVKLRGQRIELGEVESLLVEHESVEQAVVDIRDERLVAYVVRRGGAVVEHDDLTAYAKNVLPEYMIPAAVVFLDAVPTTANGKLDRRSLPDPVRVEREFRPPGTPTERVVSAVFAEVLGLPRVGLDDDFFELGGNSLIAAQVVSRVRSALALAVPLKLMFEYSTVEGFARAVDDSAVPDDRAPLVARERPAEIPLSVQQQQTWSLSKWFPDTGHFNIPVAVRLTGDVDSDALSAAMIDVMTRHEPLRTVYPVGSDEQPIQVVLSPDAVSVDLEPVRISESDLADRVAALTDKGFDLTSVVPLRTALFAVDDADFVLVVVFHHISADGSSLAPFAQDLVTAYFARLQGEAPGWNPLPVQYADYTLWQRAMLGDPNDPSSLAARQMAFWKETLADLPDALDVPLDRPRPQLRTMAGGTVHLSLDADLHSAVDRVARENGVTRFMVVQAAMVVTLARLSGKNDVAIGTPTAGRGSHLLAPLVGMFVSTLVLRTPVDTGATFADLLSDVKNRDLSAFDNVGVPFEWIVRDLLPPRPVSQVPFFQVLMAFQNYEQQVTGLDDFGMSFVDKPMHRARVDLHFSFVESTGPDGGCGGMSVQIDYAAEMFDETTVVSLGNALDEVLSVLVNDPHVVLGDIDVRPTTDM